MFKFTRTGAIKLVIITIIFFLVQIFMYQYSKGIEIDSEINKEIMQQVNQQTPVEIEKDRTDWKIEIEKINLKAEINEGTNKKNLNKYVGHFENTPKEEGNIGLAAHNRGYEVNYFERLKELQEGDEIKYQHGSFQKTYEVSKSIIIKDTDWEKLENTEENRLTLITCVENEPNYRRCIQAIEKEEID